MRIGRPGLSGFGMPEDRRRDIVGKTRNGLEAARKRGRVGGRRPVVDDDKRAAILSRRERGQSIRTIAAGVKVSVGVVHKTLALQQTGARGSLHRPAPTANTSRRRSAACRCITAHSVKAALST